MTALLRAADTVPAEPIRLERPWWLPQVPKRSLDTLAALEREHRSNIADLCREQRRIERELEHERNLLATVKADQRDHAENLLACEFPEGAA